MRDLAGSAFLLVLLLPAFLAAGPPSGATPVVASEPMSGRSHAQAAKAACALPGACLAQASAGEPDEIRPVETAQSPAPTRSSVPAAVDSICNALAAAAAENDLPIDFFTRLIWQESRFDPTAVSRAGAQGVAQFMPATASWRGLADPFDPVEAIAKSAKLLRDLRREFGNLGLAAAAYNAGPGRVRDWLAGRRGLPRETRAYVSPRDRPIRRAMDRSSGWPCRDARCKRRAVSADRWPFRSSAGARSQAGRSLGRAIGRKLVRRDGARRLSQIAGKVRVHPGGPRATHRSPRARARQHGLGAGPRRGGEPHECRKIVREPACRRRELTGATQLREIRYHMRCWLFLPGADRHALLRQFTTLKPLPTRST